jgi:hypothetical protein
LLIGLLRREKIPNRERLSKLGFANRQQVANGVANVPYNTYREDHRYTRSGSSAANRVIFSRYPPRTSELKY